MQSMSEFNLAVKGIWSPITITTHKPLPIVRTKKQINREDIYHAIIDEFRTHFRQLMDLYHVYDPKPSQNYRRLSISLSNEKATFYLYFQSDLPADLIQALVTHSSFVYQSNTFQPKRMTFIRKRTYTSIYDVGSDSRESSPEPL